MTSSKGSITRHSFLNNSSIPCLEITKIGIVSRDYRKRFDNGYRDFSYTMDSVLKSLEKLGCDAILFSLFSIVPRASYSILNSLVKTSNIKAVFLEEFQDGTERTIIKNVVWHNTNNGWEQYDYSQKFYSLTVIDKYVMRDFVSREMPKRIFGNCCVLLCGESNGVKYSKASRRIEDTFGLRRSIPNSTKIVLNPVHDRMTRFEMNMKRQFLSENGRWVVSVWNKGKELADGRVRDGEKPAWIVFHDGVEVYIPSITNNLGVEIGIVDFMSA